jgi:response regulator RpfG family c-di-GMP phosphodiesterase
MSDIQTATSSETARIESLTDPQWTILCVDDEQNIVSSLRRIFRRHSYRVVTANSGGEALSLLETEPVDVVISDMRMPEMDGAQFLEQVRLRWPNTVRLLLTGFADIDSTIDAINCGEIYRYVAKPWDDNELLTTVRQGLERKTLEQEKRRLEALSRLQNAELRDLNTTLEARVLERTAEVRRACDDLASANSTLKANFLTSIKVFSSLIELREGNKYAGHSRRVAELARQLSNKMGMNARDTQDVFIAGLLHEIGKIGLPETIINAPLVDLDGTRLEAYRKHPIRGAQLLMPLGDLRNVAAILRSHCERYDGNGFPDGLAGSAISLGAGILAVAKDYDGAQIGMIARRRMAPEEAVALIMQGRGKQYDPSIIDVFSALISGTESETSAELWVPASGLSPGMTLSRDLFGGDGALLLSADHVLDEVLIHRIKGYQASAAKALTIHVRA